MTVRRAILQLITALDDEYLDLDIRLQHLVITTLETLLAQLQLNTTPPP